jgi:hypothetical protein
MRHGHGYAHLGLLLGVIIQACDRGSPVVPNEGGPYRSVEIDLGSLLRRPGESIQPNCAWVVAEAVLSVTPEGGAARVFRKDVPAGASTVQFDSLEVPQGAVEFAVQIISNNGTLLYSKEVSQQIEAGTFSVPILMDKKSPVLQVCPADTVLGRIFVGNGPTLFFTRVDVKNRGLDSLVYHATSPACADGPCLSFVPLEGHVAAGETDSLFPILDRMAPQASLELIVESPEGSVPVTVGLPQLPELVPVSLDSTGPHETSTDSVAVPVRVVIRNDGNVAAGLFQLAAEFTDTTTGVTSAGEFRVPGQADQVHPFTLSPLEPGGEITLDGVVVLFGPPQGKTLQLSIEVDTCSGDQSLPFFCQVEEFDESNNFSAAIPVLIPSF